MNLKKFGKVFTSKSVGTGPSSYEKNNLPGRGLTKVVKHCNRSHCEQNWLSRGYEPVVRLRNKIIYSQIVSSEHPLQ